MDLKSAAAYNAGGMHLIRGRVREAERWSTLSVVDPADTPQGRAERLYTSLDSAWAAAYYFNDANAARAIIKRTLARTPMDSLPAGDRPWQQLVAIAAVIHDGPAAHAYEASLLRDLPMSKQAAIVGYKDAVHGVVAMADNHPKDAIPLLETAYKGYVRYDDTGPWLAQAFDLTNQPDSAIAGFESFLDAPDVYDNSRKNFLAASYKRLGELYDAKHNDAKAIEYYQKFVDLWKDADPELQPVVKQAKTRLDDLRKKGGRG